MKARARTSATAAALALSLLGGSVLAGCNGSLERLPEPEVDASQKVIAERLATKIVEGCRTGKHEALEDSEAISEMRYGLTPEKQKATCDSVTAMFGDYVSLDYAETWKFKYGALRVYRFKGHFAKGAAPEIRVVLDAANKLSGFWLKPWTDTPQ